MSAQDEQRPDSTLPPTSYQSAAPIAVPGQNQADSLGNVDDSPELLRWRADILLDEMMLGGASSGEDAAVGKWQNGSHQTDASHQRQTDARRAVHDEDRSAYGAAAEARFHSPRQDGRASRSDLPASETATGPIQDSSWSATWQDWAPARSQEPDASASRQPARRGLTDDDPGRYDQGRYEQDDVEQNDRSAARDSSGSRPTYFAAGERGPVRPLSDAADDNLLRPPSASVSSSDYAGYGGNDPVEAPSASPRGRRGDQVSQVRRSNLLPRLSQPDVRALQQELSALQDEVEVVLPSEHEWHKRTRHLLDKASLILNNNPDRSAEVDYYLQQVRSILGRAQQSTAASAEYQKRLMLYHTAWLVLALIVLLACGLYARSITEWVAPLLGVAPQQFPATHFVPFVATLAFAGVGTAAGALRNMRRYSRRERGYFDHKYGLRSVLLPVFALLFGLAVYLLFGLIAWIAGLNPLATPLVLLVPIGATFGFGFLQESVYGTAP
ncbi:MAG: hypothetical protein KDD78_02745 [Caldilineaceae bacterium]|nr:hypothetical protein [Caldilineaceae bacterium]